MCNPVGTQLFSFVIVRTLTPSACPSVCLSRAYDLLEIRKPYRNFKFGGDMTLDMSTWCSKFEIKRTKFLLKCWWKRTEKWKSGVFIYVRWFARSSCWTL